jgi:hypothetical protein
MKMNEYDDNKRMLNIVRNIQENQKKKIQESYIKILKEQREPIEDQPIGKTDSKEKKNVENINGVDVYIDSTDDMDLEINPDEKSKISQLIDDFKKDVSELNDLMRITIQPNSFKFEGKIITNNLEFVFSAGADSGLDLTNATMLKIDDNVLEMINKLKLFLNKFNSVAEELLSYRNEN